VVNFLPSPILISSSPANLHFWACPKLSSSPDFNRDHNAKQVFLNFCTLYICLALEQFSYEEKKALWALTFFKSSCMAKWSENLFCQKVNTGFFPIQTWINFKAQFKVQFFLVNTEADMVNTLEGVSYYQGTQMVDNYLDNSLEKSLVILQLLSMLQLISRRILRV